MKEGKKAMTNDEMILKETALLQLDGTLESNEVLHTFQKWKQLGYHVKKGEKAIITMKLWKYKKPKKESQPLLGVGSDEETKEKNYSYYYLTNAYMFSSKQVEKK
jgi:hypothetical protein